MKICLLTGDLKNAGDFLIAQRSYELIQFVYPSAKITKYSRWLPLDHKLEELNSNDIIIFSGGPGCIPDFYPGKVPFITNLNNLKTKIFIMGMGWWGSDTRNQVLYKIQFYKKTLELFKRAEQDTKEIGCRDWYTVRLLKNNGLKYPIMTGCPGWYNLNEINKTDYKKIDYFSSEIKKICISDPSYIYNFKSALELVNYIKKRYPSSKLYFIFHRGYHVNIELAKCWNIPSDYLHQKLLELGVSCFNISDSFDKLIIYDDCDLHIGFRVHAHIYNLSKHNRSILIEEDGRGAGVNQALGLPSLSPYKIDSTLPKDIVLTTKKNKCKFNINNEYLVQNIEDALFCIESSNQILLKNAYSSLNHYYPEMLRHIKSIQKFI